MSRMVNLWKNLNWHMLEDQGLCQVRAKNSLGQTISGSVGSSQLTGDLSLSVLTHT